MLYFSLKYKRFTSEKGTGMLHKTYGKTLIIHDRFQFQNKTKQLILDLAKILDADIVTEFWTDTTYPKSEVPHSLTV